MPMIFGDRSLLKRFKASSEEVPLDRELILVGEENFLFAVAQERKRSDRSGKPFLLVLLTGHYEGEEGAETVRKVMTSFVDSTRETDIVGWYREGEALGVIFTELPRDKDESLKVIMTRVTESLNRGLDPQELDAISITCHIYPEAAAKTDEPQRVKMFYPAGRTRTSSRKGAHFLKRVMDVSGSLAAIVMLSPIFAVIAILVKLTSQGPVFYRQTRIGQYGAGFTFLKFRSMYANSDPKIHQEFMKNVIGGSVEKNATKGSKCLYKMTNDPRVTPLGRFIRRTSLDELPQFFNVLRGDMALVGPRPPVPYEFECYDVWHRRRVFEVKPGITGLWQVVGRNRVDFDGMVRLDLQYVRTWSLWLDLKILVKTPLAVFSGDGAY
ncbi:MAG: sugar transferase [Terriglobales bacterium]